MANLDRDAVDKLIDLLTLPIGGKGDQRPTGYDDIIQQVSADLGLLAFEDTEWYRSHRPEDIEDILQNWFDDSTATELATRAVGPESPQQWSEFLAWCKELVAGWAQVESSPQAIANPRYESDKVDGTQFYRYVDGWYLYAATPDAPAEDWKTQEERYEAAWQAAGAAVPTDTVMGYPNGSSVLTGTAFYRQLENGTYVYAPTQHAAAEAWRPYEYWSDQAYAEAAEQELLSEMGSYLDTLENVLGQ
jgi:hypothetical protein